MPLSVGLNTVVSTPLSVYQLRHHFSYKNPLLPLLDSLYSDLSLVQNRLTNFQVLSNSKVYRMTRTFPYDTLGNNKSFPFAVFRASSSFLSIISTLFLAQKSLTSSLLVSTYIQTKWFGSSFYAVWLLLLHDSIFLWTENVRRWFYVLHPIRRNLSFFHCDPSVP